MALEPLATTADLAVRSMTLTAENTALAVASEAIRDAARSPIKAVTTTVTVVAPVLGTVLTLPTPVTAVTAVSLDGSEVTDYQNLGNGLWRRNGWGCEPVPVEVTATFGFADVPADIVDLTCQLAKAWDDHQNGGGGSTAGLKSAKLDDSAEAYTDEAAGQVSPVFIPQVTRDWLAARFSGGAFVVETL